MEPLRRLIELLPNLSVVMLHGDDAKSVWKRLAQRHPAFAPLRRVHVIATYHTGGQAFRHQDEAVREGRKERLRAAFGEAAKRLSGP